jgi:PAS domain S-box-containing protein
MYLFNVFSLLSLLVAELYLILGILVLFRGFRNLANWLFFLTAMTMSIWGLGEGMLRAAVISETALIWGRYIAPLGSAFYGAFLVHFWLVFSGRKNKRSVGIMAMIFYFASFIFLLGRLFYSGWFIKGVIYHYWGYSVDGTSLYVVYMGYLLMCILTVICLSFRDAGRVVGSLKKQYKNIGFSITVTMMVALISQVLRPIIHLEIPEFTVASSIFFVSMVAYIVGKYGILTITGKVVAQNIVETMDDMVLAVDTLHNITYTNYSVINNLGFGEAELIGKPISSVVEGDLFKKIPVVNFESICVGKNGNKLKVLINASLLYGGPGEVVGYVLVLRDVSRMGELVSELEKSKTELERNVNELERFKKLVVDRELVMVEMKRKLEKYESGG